jgi:mannose-6-phosphate isomerase-like protein (cupin superfamily)
MRVSLSFVVLLSLGLSMTGGTSSVMAQTTSDVPVPPPVQPSPGVDYRPAQSLEELAGKLLQASESTASGNVSVTLDKFPSHFTMLSTRVKSGGAELHKNYSDIFVVVDGEATEVTGGTIVDPTNTGNEIRGTRVEGGVAQVLRKGDVITIAPNTPHQTMVAPGKTFTYFVVKVAALQ